MKVNFRKHLSVLLTLSLLVAGPTEVWSQGTAGGWMKVRGVQAEKLKSQSGEEFMVGYFCGTDLCDVGDGAFVAAGYLQQYDGHPVELGLLKFSGDGTTVWFKEYGPQGVPPATPALDSNSFPWASLSVRQGGGVTAVFENVVLKTGADGMGAEARYYEPFDPTSGMAEGRVKLTSHAVMADGSLLVCGLLHKLVGNEPAAVIAARIDPAGGVAWCSLLSGLHACPCPRVILGTDNSVFVGSEPAAIVSLDAAYGAVRWSRKLALEPFTRGPESHLQSGTSLGYRSLAVDPDGDLIFSGDYVMVCPLDKGTGALIARLNQNATAFKWIKRLHSAAHGGRTLVNNMRATNDAIFLTGTAWSFQTPEVLANNNSLAVKMDPQGNVQWIRSLGKKRMSQAKSEYRNELGNALVATADGGMVFAGGTDAFALPDPGFHRVIGWAKEHYDMLLCRITSGGGIASLPEGRYPALLSSPDPADDKRVDVSSPPLALEELSVEAKTISLRGADRDYLIFEGSLQDKFTTYPDASGHQPKADFTLVKPDDHKNMQVQFDSTPSTDPDGGAIMRREWSFGDEGASAATKPVHRFATPGIRKTALTVWNNQGYSGSTAYDVMVGALLDNQGIPPAFCSEKTTSYGVEVVTGNSDGAGTDATVHLVLYGPADKNGVRFAGGDFTLDSNTSTNKQSDLFERDKTDTFTLSSARALDSIDQIILRHANDNGNRPEWQVTGLMVRSADKKSEWLFVADTWLQKGQPKYNTTITLKPQKPYPMGMLFKSGSLSSHNANVVRDRIAILPATGDKFYLTSLDKAWGFEVWTPSGSRIGIPQQPTGEGVVRLPYIKETNWGVGIALADIKTPTRYVIKLTNGNQKEESMAWLFPNGWTGYETEALRLAFILPMEGKLDAIFAPVAKAAEYLPAGDGEPDYAAIIAYGADSFRIFNSLAGENLQLRSYAQNQVAGYALSVSGAAAKMMSKTTSGIFGGLTDILGKLIKAQEWAAGLPEIMELGADPAYSDDVLKEIAGGTRFRQIVNLFDVLKTNVQSLIEKAKAGDQEACRDILGNIRLLCVGPNPSGSEIADHTISYENLGVSKLDTPELCLGAMLAQELEHIKSMRADPNGHSVFGIKYYQDILAQQKQGIDVGLDPKGATNRAMDYYEPIIWDLYGLVSPFLNLSLYEK